MQMVVKIITFFFQISQKSILGIVDFLGHCKGHVQEGFPCLNKLQSLAK